MRGTTLQTPKSVEKETEEVLRVLEQDSPAACEDHDEAGCTPLDHVDP